MYFYFNKIYKNEPIKLLEMCSDACICIRNDERIYGLTQNTQLKYRLQLVISATVLFFTHHHTVNVQHNNW